MLQSSWIVACLWCRMLKFLCLVFMDYVHYKIKYLNFWLDIQHKVQLLPLIKSGPVDLFLNFKKVFISDLANNLRALCQCLFRWFRSEIISDISVNKEFHLYPCKESKLYVPTQGKSSSCVCKKYVYWRSNHRF